jgi:uncharacterized protein YjbI with pentapeptide repeats
MAQENSVRWQTCESTGCIGVRPDSSTRCLAHCTAADRTAALKPVREAGAIDARGVSIDRALLAAVLEAAPRGKNSEPLIKDARFDQATFLASTSFGSVTFYGDARFDGATFHAPTSFGDAAFHGDAEFTEAIFHAPTTFGDATFHGDAEFTEAIFHAPTTFGSATFHGDAEFDRAIVKNATSFGSATFYGDARFSWATFQNNASFNEATFHRDAWFDRTTFEEETGFTGATFIGSAVFDRATFSGRAQFDRTTFKSTANFDSAVFEQSRQFGPVLAYRGLRLDGVRFAQLVQIEVSTTGLCCRGAQFPGGVQFRLRWARVALDDTDLPAPSILAGIPRLSSDELAQREEQISRAWQRLRADEISERPQLLSLRRANVAGLGLSNVSAADCRFAGAHNLDKLRLESDVAFMTAPRPLRRQAAGGRQVIAEECAWRAGQPWRTASPSPLDQGVERRGWVVPWWPNWLDDQRPGKLDPGQIAGLYRALRKGREDAKDEPGAADFYYGEMEMRLRANRDADSAGSPARQGSWVERAILAVYWLVSGYGLRASRALVSLIVVLAAATIMFVTIGFGRLQTIRYQPIGAATSGHAAVYEQIVAAHGSRPGWAAAVTYSVDGATSLLRPAQLLQPLTAAGEATEVALRLLGPLLLGLAVLAVRNRVKR